MMRLLKYIMKLLGYRIITDTEYNADLQVSFQKGCEYGNGNGGSKAIEKTELNK